MTGSGIWILAAPLLIGFLIDLLLGDPYCLPHPVRAIGSMISRLERAVRKHFADNLRFGGAVLALAVLTVTTGAAWAVLYAAYRIGIWIGIAAESVMCYYLIAAKCLRNESMKVCRALEEKDTEKARKAVSMIVGRDTGRLDAAGITRAAVETVAENTSDGVTAPMLFIAFGGAGLRSQNRRDCGNGAGISSERAYAARPACVSIGSEFPLVPLRAAAR